MKLTKEECLEALNNFWEAQDENYSLYWSRSVLKKLIEEHFEDLSWKEIAMINQNLGTKYLEKYNELYKEHLILKEEKERLERMLETFK